MQVKNVYHKKSAGYFMFIRLSVIHYSFLSRRFLQLNVYDIIPASHLEVPGPNHNQKKGYLDFLRRLRREVFKQSIESIHFDILLYLCQFTNHRSF
jgi:hypothetical protein